MAKIIEFKVGKEIWFKCKECSILFSNKKDALDHKNHSKGIYKV